MTESETCGWCDRPVQTCDAENERSQNIYGELCGKHNASLWAMTALDDEIGQNDTCGLCGGSFNDEGHIFLSGDCPSEIVPQVSDKAVQS